MVLAFIYFYLYLQNRKAYLRCWSISWFCYVLVLFLSAHSSQVEISLLERIGIEFFTLLSGIFLIRGVYKFIEKPLPKWVVLAYLGCGAWVTFTFLAHLPEIFRYLATFTLLASTYIQTGLLLLRYPPWEGIVKPITGWTLVLFGLKNLLTPYLQGLFWHSHWGFFLDSLATIIITVGALLIYFEKRKRDFQDRERHFRQITENMVDMVSLVDAQGVFQYASPSHRSILGYEPADLQGKPMLTYTHPEDINKVSRSFRQAILNDSSGRVEYRYRKSDGSYLWVESIGNVQCDEQGRITSIIISTRDVTKQKEFEEHLKYLSLHDPLTKLYNRTYFEQELERLADSQQPMGMIVCDVNGLKLINDTLGHHAGDLLLISAAEVIQSCFRGQDMVARIGGDEFAILLPGSDAKALEGASRRIKNAVQQFNAAHAERSLSISIGYAVGKPPFDILEIFKEADNYMYRRKLHHSKSARSAIVQTLLKALEARDFITEGHADRLQDMVENLGHQVDLPTNRITDLRLLAQFHDIGKVGIPDRILFKEGPLTAEETKEMQRHSEIGFRIAQSAPELLPVADWILKHHEWWNGQGYPLGLQGDEIPLECRILAIADAYDAMTSDRPYRKALPQTAAILELEKNAGIQFDPLLVHKFVELLVEQREGLCNISQQI